MSLQKLTFNEARKIRIEKIMQELYRTGDITSTNLNEHLIFKHGKPNDKNDIEWLLVQIIELHNFIGIMRNFVSDLSITKIKGVNRIKENAIVVITTYISEYQITMNNGFITKYAPKESKTIIDNIKDIPTKLANPIKELLKPNISEIEIVGLISQTYKEFEQIKPQSLTNLNEIDQSLYKNVWKLAKQLANNVDGAKGHKGKSELSIKDIAHNYALNASLIQKLIQMNKDKK